MTFKQLRKLVFHLVGPVPWLQPRGECSMPFLLGSPAMEQCPVSATNLWLLLAERRTQSPAKNEMGNMGILPLRNICYHIIGPEPNPQHFLPSSIALLPGWCGAGLGTVPCFGNEFVVLADECNLLLLKQE